MDANAVGKVNKDHWLIRFAVGICMLAAGGVLLYVSATMNFRFGYSLGKTPEDAELYGKFSAAADTLKVLLPFVVMWAFRQKLYALGVGALIAAAVCTAWGITGSAGHLASNRLEVTSQRAVKADSYKDLRADKERMVKQLEAWTAAVNRPSDAIKAEIAGAKVGNRMWATTSGCTADVTTRDRREFCQSFQKLEADLGTAMKREEYQRKLEEVTAKLDKATEGENAGKVGASETDPQASILSRLTSGIIGVPMWQVIMAILGVAVLEIAPLGIPVFAFTYMFGVSMRVIDLTPDETSSAAAPALTSAATPLALAAPGAPPGVAQGAGLLVQQAEPAATTAPEQPKDPPAAVDGVPKAAPAAVDTRPINPFLGQPEPGAEHDLREIKFPIDGRPPGGIRPKLPVKEEAENFVRALQAFGVTGRSISKTDMPLLYRQYATANYRAMVEEAELLKAMTKMETKGCEHNKVMRYEKDHPRFNPDKPDNKRDAYRIKARDFRKAAAARGVGGSNVVPSLAAPANDVAPLPTKIGTRRVVSPTRSFAPDCERWELVNSRAHKGAMRGFSRKQRGSRMHKMGMAA